MFLTHFSEVYSGLRKTVKLATNEMKERPCCDFQDIDVTQYCEKLFTSHFTSLYQLDYFFPQSILGKYVFYFNSDIFDRGNGKINFDGTVY